MLWNWAAVTVLAVQAGLEVFLVVGRHRRHDVPPLTGLVLPAGLVDRPEQLNEVIRALTGGGDTKPVGITATAALTGAAA